MKERRESWAAKTAFASGSMAYNVKREGDDKRPDTALTKKGCQTAVNARSQQEKRITAAGAIGRRNATQPFSATESKKKVERRDEARDEEEAAEQDVMEQGMAGP